MIALATHGRTGLSRLILGSVAERVLRLSPVPVLVLRPFSSYEIAKTGRPEDEPLRKILVPVDGSELQRAVVPHASALAQVFGARIVLLHVRAPVMDQDRTAAEDEEIGKARHALRETAIEFSAAGVACLTLLEEGEAASRILGIARDHDVDLIAMATHDRRGIARWVSRSTTERVLQGARVPLLVVSAEGASRVQASRSRRQPSRR